ncbi:MAG: HTH-type transcriptional regulator/antitoxin HipB [Oleiphilaceae bacterium]|jgi:HTH-type transcriptional regulator/antitoxin HipB
MKIQIKSVEELGAIGKAVRKSQDFDQATLGAFSGNGINFVSQFENGKPTAEIGRVLEILDTLGIKLTIDVPMPHDKKANTKLCNLLKNAGVNVGATQLDIFKDIKS